MKGGIRIGSWIPYINTYARARKPTKAKPNRRHLYQGCPFSSCLTISEVQNRKLRSNI